MLLFDPYYDADVELEAQVLECIKELGYEVEDTETEQPEVTVH